MRAFLSRLLTLLLVVVISVTSVGCSGGNSPTGLAGDYRQDTLTMIDTMRSALNLPEGSVEQAEAQAKARQQINEFASRYRRDSAVNGRTSFTTMRTALNSLAGHYSSYPNRPVPQSLKDRLEREFKQAEMALQRGA